MPSKKINISCPVCHERFERYESSIKKALRQSAIWICQACTLGRKNVSSAKPLLTKRKKGECVEIKTEDGWVFEHRYIMEQHLGRKLAVSEVVHHKNHNRSDNRIENLEVMDHGDHTRLHHTGLKRSDKTKLKISEAKKGSCVYENHGSYKQVTVNDLRVQYLKCGTVAKASEQLGITAKTFYNKLKHFNLNLEELCQ